jgi:IS4 transposase
LLLDRGYERYSLFNDIVRAKSDYVCRVQHPALSVVQTNDLSLADVAARVISDDLVTLPKVTHPQGRQRTDKTNSHKIVLLTNLPDAPAEVIADLYELRRSSELFFRFFKHVLGCRQLVSHKPEGVMIQVYCTLVAALSMSLALDRNIGRRGFELLCLYLQGWAEEEELLDGLRRLAASKTR